MNTYIIQNKDDARDFHEVEIEGLPRDWVINHLDTSMEWIIKQERAIVSFYELAPEWQNVATSNLDEYAEEQSYLEPLEDHNTGEHWLADLSECYPVEGEEDYNASMGISNNSGMLLKFSDDMESALVWYV